VSVRRRRARSARKELKDKVLHARIPDQLDRELRQRAGQLGLSVSTVVRNVLLHTFDLVEGIVTDSVEIARAASGHAGRHTGLPESKPQSDPANVVLGWQEIVLNLNAICDECNAILAKGEAAGVGVPVGERPVFLCPPCLSKLRENSGPRTSNPPEVVPDHARARPRRRGSTL